MNRLLIALPLLLLALAVISCGGGKSSPPTPTATTTMPATAPTAPASPTAVSPSPLPIIQPWARQAPNIGDWVWVRISGDTVFASSGPQFRGNSNFYNGPGRVTALDARTGSERWHFDTPSQPFPVTVADGRALFGTAAGTVFALDAPTGVLVWKHDFPGIPFQVIATKSLIVVGDGDPEAWGPGGIADKSHLRGRVRALDPATGNQRWEANLRDFAVFIAAAGDDILAASHSSRANDDAVLLDAAGRLKWTAAISATSAPPLVIGDAAITAGSDLRKVDLATGNLVWMMPPRNGGTFTTPMLLGDTLVAATNTHNIEARSLAMGSLTAIGDFPECGLVPLGDSPYALACGFLARVDLAPQSVKLVQVVVPQGIFQSAAFAFGQVFYASAIGDLAPPSVGHLDPTKLR